MSEFTCPVVQIPWVKPVPNSDALEHTEVFETNVVLRKGQLKAGDLAVYIPLDSMVPMTKPQFQGLGIKTEKDLYRVKAVRLRGMYSEGLLVPLTETGGIGDDMAGPWGITKYEEPERPASIFGKAPAQQAPDLPWVPKYSVEQLVRNRDAIPEGTEVIVTEKLHGCNARFVMGTDRTGDFRLHVGSHNTWRKPIYPDKGWKRNVKAFLNKMGFKFSLAEPINDDVWWTIAKRYKLAQRLPMAKLVVYGEVFGAVQDLKYGLGTEVDFRVFDMYDADEKRWLDYDQVSEICASMGLKMVPVLYRGPYSKDVVDSLRSGKSTLDAGTIREGFVIRPASMNGHKSVYKYVSEEYKLRKGVTTEFH